MSSEQEYEVKPDDTKSPKKPHDIKSPEEPDDAKSPEKPTQATSIEIKKWRAGLFIFCSFIFGINTLIGWNSFLTNTVYFKERIKNTTNIYDFFEPTLTFTSTFIAIFGNIVNLYLLYKIKEMGRILFVNILMIVGFAVVILLLFMDLSDTHFFSAIIIIASIFNFMNPIYQTPILNEVSCLPPGSIPYHFSGAAVSGLIVSIIQIVVTPFDLSPNSTSAIYFSITIVIVIISIALYLYSIRSKEYINQKKLNMKNSSQNIFKPLPIKQQALAYITIFKRRYRDILAVFLTLGITLSIWPVIPIKIASIFPNTTWGDHYFTNVMVFLAYNLGDVIGRYGGAYVKWPKVDSIWVVICSAMRILFIIPFLCCNMNSPNNIFPNILNHDVAPIIFVLLFGITNGHIFVISMQAPYILEKGNDTKTATNLFVTVIGIALLVGSAFSFAFALI